MTRARQPRPLKPRRRRSPDVGHLVCSERSSEGDQCNRIADHDGPHQNIRARDFVVTAEWSDVEPDDSETSG